MPRAIASLTADAVPLQCRHIRPDGRRCGSPALRSGHFCYHHDLNRRPGTRQPQVNTARAAKLNTFDLPNPADLSERAGLQLAVAQILGKIANNEIDPRRAGLLLYGLQIASAMLPKSAKAEPALTPATVVDEVIQDPDLGPLAPEVEWAEPETGRTGRRIIERWLEEMEAESPADELRRSSSTPHAGTMEPQPGLALNAGRQPNRRQRRALLSRLHRSTRQPASHAPAPLASRSHGSLPAGPLTRPRPSATLITDTDSKGRADGPELPPPVQERTLY